jgi:hypothetical protein
MADLGADCPRPPHGRMRCLPPVVGRRGLCRRRRRRRRRRALDCGASSRVRRARMPPSTRALQSSCSANLSRSDFFGLPQRRRHLRARVLQRHWRRLRRRGVAADPRPPPEESGEQGEERAGDARKILGRSASLSRRAERAARAVALSQADGVCASAPLVPHQGYKSYFSFGYDLDLTKQADGSYTLERPKSIIGNALRSLGWEPPARAGAPSH